MEKDGGDGRTTMWMPLMSWNCILKDDKIVNCMLWIFFHTHTKKVNPVEEDITQKWDYPEAEITGAFLEAAYHNRR